MRLLERERGRRRADVTPVEGLARFAYEPSLTSRTPSSVDLAPSRPTRVVAKDPPDPQLAQLSKCVGCGLHWTSRKTAKQKRIHIEQCAKKNALNKDTVKFLIKKEIAILSSAKTIAANDPNENAASTLMDSVVPTGPVQKLKHPQVVLTVRSPTEARENILHRARNILGPTGGQADQPTQQFGQSALVHRNIQQSRRPTLLDANRPTEKPLPNQPFGVNSLRGEVMASELLVDDTKDLPTQWFGASMFAQDSVLSSDRRKRPAPPPPLVDGDPRDVRRRLLR